MILILIFLNFSLILQAQQVSTYTSNEIVELANLRDFNEAVLIVTPTDLYNIDQQNAIEFAKIELQNASYPFSVPYQSIELAKGICDDELKNILFESYNKLPYYFNSYSDNNRNKIEKRVTNIPFDLLIALINQNPLNLADSLKTDFYELKNISEDIESKYPFVVIRMFQYLIYGQPKYMRINQDIKFNYLKLAVVLNHLGENEFDDNFVNKIRKEQLGTYYKKYDFNICTLRDSLLFEPIILNSKYESIMKLTNDEEFCINQIYPVWFQQNNPGTTIIRVINELENMAFVDVINKAGCRVSRLKIVIKLLNENLCEVASYY